MKLPPQSLSEITLSQWVGYQNTFGTALEKRLQKIQTLTGKERENEYFLWNVDLHLQNYSWYTNTPMNEVFQMNSSEVIKVMGAAFILHVKEQSLLNYSNTFSFNGKDWKIQPIIPQTEKLTKEQYDLVTDLALIFSDLQDGKHEALYELCAAYLRQPNEPFTGALVDQSGERVTLMKDLPLSISLCVKMYVEKSIHLLFGKK